MIRIVVWIAAALPFCALAAWPTGQGSENAGVSRRASDFAMSPPVAKLFDAHCVACHSKSAPSGGLDLSSDAGLNRGGVSGPAVVAAKPEASLLVQRMLGHGGKSRMPLGFSPLDEANMKIVMDWIADGARSSQTVKTHWAYIKPVEPPVPAESRNPWARNEIDGYVLAAMRNHGLDPSPEAQRSTLVRRLSLDLTGLPPTPEETQRFVDDKSPDSYERLVDRLLASPHFGERMARMWLDWARYADSDGYEKDLGRTAWLYRDWVINAFNENMPYDQFATQQIAGDLVADGGMRALIATGFQRNTMLNLEGGVDQAEAQYEVIADRTDTTGRVWLGTTLQCARCHTHKFDPITQEEYFRMYAYFANNVVVPRGNADISEEKWVEPMVQVPSAEQKFRLDEIDAVLKRLQAKIDEAAQSLRSDFGAATPSGRSKWQAISQLDASTDSVAGLTVADGVVTLSGRPKNAIVKLTLDLPAGTRAIRLEALPDPSLPNGGPGLNANGNFVLSSVALESAGKNVPLFGASTTFVQERFDATGVLDQDPNTGWAVDGNTGKRSYLAVGLDQPLAGDAKVTLTLSSVSTNWPLHVLGRFRVSWSSSAYALLDTYSSEIAAMLQAPANDIVGQHVKRYHPETARAWQHQADLQAEKSRLEMQIPSAMVLQEKKDGKPTAWVRKRGEFLNPGNLVWSGTPSFGGALPLEERGDRLALARWIVSEENPLSARVQVNRLWDMVFGRGIVATLDDFGTQGSPPSNQPLLDHLALRYMKSGWDTKALLKMIVTSATYRQSSAADAARLEKDPTNLWLSRAPRFRMEAEMLRDNVLAVSGLLDPKVGGPSVYPFQPEGTWNTPYSGEAWVTGNDAQAYRRGLYTYWKRSAPFPAFMLFDAPDRQVCTAKRSVTNTPLQALAQLNDETVLAASKAMAKGLVAAPGEAKERVRRSFGACTGRAPTKDEESRLLRLVRELSILYDTKTQEADKLGGRDMAVWTMFCNTLLNLDATVTKS